MRRSVPDPAGKPRLGRPAWSTLKEELVEAAVKVLKEGGPLTIRALANEVDKSQQAIYLHYEGGLDAIKAAVVARGFEQLAKGLKDATVKPGEPKARLSALVGAYFRFADTNQGLFRLMFAGEVPQELWRGQFEARKATLAVVEETVKDAQQAHVLPRKPVEELTVMLWALMHSMTVLLIEGQPYFEKGDQGIRRLVEKTVRTFLTVVGPTG
jgi:AcrR family transcriptional regulator